MKIKQEFVAELFCVVRHCQRVFQIVRQVATHRLNENAQANPVVAVIFEKLQTGRGVRAVLENFSAILGLFQKREVRPEGKFRGVRRKAPTSREAPSSKHTTAVAKYLELGGWNFSGAWRLELGAFSFSHRANGIWKSCHNRARIHLDSSGDALRVIEPASSPAAAAVKIIFPAAVAFTNATHSP